jgi:hypothetical protein
MVIVGVPPRRDRAQRAGRVPRLWGRAHGRLGRLPATPSPNPPMPRRRLGAHARHLAVRLLRSSFTHIKCAHSGLGFQRRPTIWRTWSPIRSPRIGGSGLRRPPARADHVGARGHTGEAVKSGSPPAQIAPSRGASGWKRLTTRAAGACLWSSSPLLVEPLPSSGNWPSRDGQWLLVSMTTFPASGSTGKLREAFKGTMRRPGRPPGSPRPAWRPWRAGPAHRPAR